MQYEYRDEQMWAGEMLKMILPSGYELKYEVELTSLHSVGEMKGKYCKPDMVLFPDFNLHVKKIAIRMNGGIHMKKLNKIKDEDQRILLEGNGFKVVDFNVDDMPALFSCDKKNRKKEAMTEILEAMRFIWE